MKYPISKVTWTALAVVLFSLSACAGKHESQGKTIGKSLDQIEKKAERKINQGKETANDAKEDVKKKGHELLS